MSMKLCSCLLLSICSAGLFAVTGCGDSRNSASVSGKITLNGQPLADMGVTFEPMGGNAARGSYGKTDASGSYTLSFIDNDQPGAIIGKHQVSFADLQGGPVETPDAGPAPPVKTRLPASYRGTSIEYEVKSGGNQADFDLK